MMKKTAFSLFFLLVIGLSSAACRSTGDAVDTGAAVSAGDTVYTKVGMHFDFRNGQYLMYSTNFIGMPHYRPPNTQFTLVSSNRRRLVLRDAEGAEYTISWTPKHHGDMTRGEWTDRHFSGTPVQLPGGLSAAERDAIARGEGEAGMSRAALFLAIGYPPRTLTPSDDGAVLTYQTNRFVRRSFELDDRGRVRAVGR